MAMIFHHGGAGTTAFGFRSGVPCCVIPFLFDQFFWGKQVSQLGVGPEQIPYKKLTTRKLIRAIESSIHDTDMQNNAADLGKKIRLENGVDRAVEIIEKMISSNGN
jgi:sterol 3beta-glucosyltransferase